jgi:hypothetical protein
MIKRWSYVAQKNPVKYGIVGTCIRNNLSYWNFSKFEMEFELKIRESFGAKFE